eukprot:gnl/TRDRNA2_/TRDRNA2_168092_c2_seq3.p1 gnl/TRDRNA2_/TRDRNA2_168092_c2~~gnl/TRDRNA2_/TRDRNA2_168092_c2_seq3.p1  ORF type:complete len:245 (-),score=35.22 gnl/TRDRNA2_/TRDRNA2_168092_c2_seq3:258-992(-)
MPKLVSQYCTECSPSPNAPRELAKPLPGLPGAYFMWLNKNQTFIDQMFEWQNNNRHFFQTATEEFTLEATIAFNDFMRLVDGYLAVFCSESGTTEDHFAAELQSFQDSDDPRTKRFFSMITKKTDFLHWASMLRKNICLCCGGGFRELGATYATSETVPAPYVASPEVAPVATAGWTAHRDEATGKMFYQNLADGTTSWDSAGYISSIQAGLPAGWTAHMDEATGNVFYQNTADGSTSWEMPVA